jgi:hypothetical protein
MLKFKLAKPKELVDTFITNNKSKIKSRKRLLKRS